MEGNGLELSDHLAVRRFTYVRRRSVRNPGPRRAARVSVLMGMLVVATLVAAGSPGASRRPAEASQAERWRLLPVAPAEAASNVLVWTGTEVLDVGWDVHGSALGVGGSALDPTTGRWRILPFAPLPDVSDSGQLVGAWTGTELVVIASGGSLPEQTVALAYRPDGDGWEPRPAPPASLGRVSTVLWTGRDVVAFGISVHAAATLRRGATAWREVPAPRPTLPDGLWSYAAGRDLVVIDGNSTRAKRQAWQLDGLDRRWHAIPLPPLDPYGTLTVWTGRRLLLLQRACRTTAALAEYDPRTRTWSDRQIDPSPLSCTTSFMPVWTSDELILVPTERRRSALGPDGAALNPSTGRWRALPGAPEAAAVEAAGPKAIWDGTEVVAVAGRDITTGGYGTSAAYQPPRPLPHLDVPPKSVPATSVPACSASSLHATFSGLEPMSRSMGEGTISLTNTGTRPCRVEGQAGLELHGADASLLPVTVQPMDHPFSSDSPPVILDPATPVTADAALEVRNAIAGDGTSEPCPSLFAPPTGGVTLILASQAGSVPVIDPPGETGQPILRLGACDGVVSLSPFSASDTTG